MSEAFAHELREGDTYYHAPAHLHPILAGPRLVARVFDREHEDAPVNLLVLVGHGEPERVQLRADLRVLRSG